MDLRSRYKVIGYSLPYKWCTIVPLVGGTRKGGWWRIVLV